MPNPDPVPNPNSDLVSNPNSSQNLSPGPTIEFLMVSGTVNMADNSHELSMPHLHVSHRVNVAAVGGGRGN